MLTRLELDCDPRVPLQRSKLENQENDIFGAKKKALFGVPLGTISMGFLGHLIASLNTKQGFSIEGGN